MDNKQWNNSHIIREEDVEKNRSDGDNYASKQGGGHEKDIYNSEFSKKNKLLNPDFFRFFKLPLIAVIFLIALFLLFKFLFFHKPGVAGVKMNPKRNVKVYLKKRFSPSVFDYADKTKKDKFNIKFNKEMKGLRYRAKLRSKGKKTSKITKKMVVFIKASYGKAILNAERGVKMKNGNNTELVKSDLAAAENFDKRSEPVVPLGTVLDAYIKYKIFSYNTAVPVIAILVENFYDRGETVLRKGDKFFGTVTVKHSLNRLNIKFKKIIETDGKSINISAIAMMPDGSGGIVGDVHNRYAANILESIAQGVVSAASIFVGGGSGFNSSNPYTFQNRLRENVAQNELNQARNGINKYVNSNKGAVSITLPKDTPIKIIFLKPLYAA